jgi:hypothetical protein
VKPTEYAPKHGSWHRFAEELLRHLEAQGAEIVFPDELNELRAKAAREDSRPKGLPYQLIPVVAYKAVDEETRIPVPPGTLLWRQAVNEESVKYKADET